jgi:hypothetical protein
MKKIIAAFLILSVAGVLNAQSYQLNVTFTADSWGLMSALYSSKGDSTAARFERKLHNTVQANLPINSWSQNITVDTVPNAVINWIYATYRSLPEGLTTLYGNSILTVINAMTHPDIVAHRAIINQQYIDRRINEIRPEAKRKNIDN